METFSLLDPLAARNLHFNPDWVKPTMNQSDRLTILLPPEMLSSFKHKIKRIFQEEQFVRHHSGNFNQLTNREVEVLTLLAEGHNNPTIADELFISRKTVEQHRKNINRKLHVKTFTDIVRYAQAFDLI